MISRTWRRPYSRYDYLARVSGLSSNPLLPVSRPDNMSQTARVPCVGANPCVRPSDWCRSVGVGQSPVIALGVARLGVVGSRADMGVCPYAPARFPPCIDGSSASFSLSSASDPSGATRCVGWVESARTKPTTCRIDGGLREKEDAPPTLQGFSFCWLGFAQ